MRFRALKKTYAKKILPGMEYDPSNLVFLVGWKVSKYCSRKLLWLLLTRENEKHLNNWTIHDSWNRGIWEDGGLLAFRTTERTTILAFKANLIKAHYSLYEGLCQSNSFASSLVHVETDGERLQVFLGLRTSGLACCHGPISSCWRTACPRWHAACRAPWCRGSSHCVKGREVCSGQLHS